MLPEPIDLSVARARRFCDGKVPTRVRDQLIWEVQARGRSITIFEHRPPWRGASDPIGLGTRREIAQFRFDQATATWVLYGANRNGRWLRVPDAPATRSIDDLLRVVDENRTGAFD